MNFFTDRHLVSPLIRSSNTTTPRKACFHILQRASIYVTDHTGRNDFDVQTCAICNWVSHLHLTAPRLIRSKSCTGFRLENGNKITLQDAPNAESRYIKEPHNYFSGSGDLVSTAADYIRFQQMMTNNSELDGVRLLGRKTVELKFKNHTGDLPIWLRRPGSGFGLGY
ncbi:MAG: hypothetical protein QGH99_12405, partial [Pseudomonadales bacterium]|nr:hypothetical protein [Pseudomonadales bacterium]